MAPAEGEPRPEELAFARARPAGRRAPRRARQRRRRPRRSFPGDTGLPYGCDRGRLRPRASSGRRRTLGPWPRSARLASSLRPCASSTFRPLSRAGLCDAETMIPASNGPVPVMNARAGVGTTPTTCTSTPRLVAPATIADTMQQWLQAEACDGFLVVPSYFPRGVEDLVHLVIPELQHRGIFRKEYSGRHLRDHLGVTSYN